MGIFLGYGLSLGIVGAGVGLVIGLLFVRHINEIADLLGRLTGRPVFDPSVYYFQKIPTIVDGRPWRWIVVGAIADRRAGQHPAGLAGRAAASRGGASL